MLGSALHLPTLRTSTAMAMSVRSASTILINLLTQRKYVGKMYRTPLSLLSCCDLLYNSFCFFGCVYTALTFIFHFLCWYRPTRVVPDQRPLNGRCCCCCSSASDSFSRFLALYKFVCMYVCMYVYMYVCACCEIY